MLNPDVDSRWP